jgi:adenosylhomocysteine nucleosidase
MPKSERQLLVFFALEEEAAPFRRLAAGRKEIEIVVSGVGAARAMSAARRALAGPPPRMVLTCGYAGALDPALQIGAVLADADPESGLAEKLSILGARPARFLCSPTILVTAAQKRQARAASSADAVEMESAPIRQICRGAGVPAATVRVISDVAEEDLPLDFNQLARPDQSLDPLKLVWAITKSPGCIPGLWRLRAHTRLAGSNLASILAGLW